MPPRTRWIEAIQAFEFQGMSLGDSEDTIEVRFEDFAYDEEASDSKAGITAYNVAASGVGYAKLFFLDGTLF
jgi:hypothetical protein